MYIFISNRIRYLYVISQITLISEITIRQNLTRKDWITAIEQAFTIHHLEIQDFQREVCSLEW